MATQEQKRRPRRTAGFTLVELMVVVSIIAILATTVGVFVLGAMDEGDQAKAKAEIRTLMTAIEMYRMKYKELPPSLDALISNPKGIKFLDQEKIPPDPWGTPYVYTPNGREFTIVSLGADKRQGGTGFEADVSSSNLRGNE
jgi:general secretion pathway protein G